MEIVNLLYISFQVKVRTLESGRVMKAATEKVVFLKELADYLQPKDTLERKWVIKSVHVHNDLKITLWWPYVQYTCSI